MNAFCTVTSQRWSDTSAWTSYRQSEPMLATLDTFRLAYRQHSGPSPNGSTHC